MKDQLKFGRRVVGHAVCLGVKYCEEEQLTCETHSMKNATFEELLGFSR